MVADSDKNGASGIWNISVNLERAEEEEIVQMPRILVLFDAENPLTFVERVSEAYKLRELTEKQLQQQLYIDSMPRSRAPNLPPEIVRVVSQQVPSEHEAMVLNGICYLRLE